MKVEVQNETEIDFKIDCFSSLMTMAESVLNDRADSLLIPVDGLLTLVLTDNHGIRLLNAEYRDKDEATDVLSFGYLEGMETPMVPGESIGEIIISLERAKKQAEERGVSFEDEVQFLFVHGLLHIAGYTHENDGKMALMFQLTDEIMGKSLPPYND